MDTHHPKLFSKTSDIKCVEEHVGVACRVDGVAFQNQRYLEMDRIKHFLAQEKSAFCVSNPPIVMNQLRRFHVRVVTGGGTRGKSLFVFPCVQVGGHTPFLRRLGFLLHDLGIVRRCFEMYCGSELFNNLPISLSASRRRCTEQNCVCYARE